MIPPSRNPDIETCTASHSGEGELVLCQNEKQRYLCDYCLPFGETFYCRHSQSLQIAARTQAGKNRLADSEPE